MSCQSEQDIHLLFKNQNPLMRCQRREINTQVFGTL